MDYRLRAQGFDALEIVSSHIEAAMAPFKLTGVALWVKEDIYDYFGFFVEVRNLKATYEFRIKDRLLYANEPELLAHEMGHKAAQYFSRIYTKPGDNIQLGEN